MQNEACCLMLEQNFSTDKAILPRIDCYPTPCPLPLTGEGENLGEGRGGVALAARRIHLQLLDTIETNLQGAIVGNDPEFLHDLRVAVRRIRSALSQIRGVFPVVPLAHFRAQFAWLQQATGSVRDLQVQQLALNNYRAKLPPDLALALHPWAEFLANQHQIAQTDLGQVLTSPRLQELLSDWRSCLETPCITCTTTKSLRNLVSARLHKLHQQVVEEGRLITADSAPDIYHDLRKHCKKLRYMLEFFQDLYDPTLAKLALKQVKTLLDTLGAYQDVIVQANMVQSNRNSLIGSVNLTDSLLQNALDTLEVTLKHRQAEIQTQFFQAFAAFNNICEQRLFKALLRS